MRNVFTVVLVLIGLFAVILLFSFYVVFSNQHIANKITPTVTISPTSTQSFCKPEELQASVRLSPGAGNVYDTFTLENISQRNCEVLGNEFIEVNYDKAAVKNITITHVGQTRQQPFTLSPGQILYSQVHYPNGPQCQSVGLHQTPVTFTYRISSTDVVTFVSQPNNIPQVIQACVSPSDITTVQIWEMSTQPITP